MSALVLKKSPSTTQNNGTPDPHHLAAMAYKKAHQSGLFCRWTFNIAPVMGNAPVPGRPPQYSPGGQSFGFCLRARHDIHTTNAKVIHPAILRKIRSSVITLAPYPALFVDRLDTACLWSGPADKATTRAKLGRQRVKTLPWLGEKYFQGLTLRWVTPPQPATLTHPVWSSCNADDQTGFLSVRYT